MTKKQIQLRTSRAAIRELLRVTNRTQREFAEDIGATPGEVRQWTSVRLVPVEYRRRIMAAMGAEWDESGKVWQAGNIKRHKFTPESFDNWRERLIEMHRHRAGFQLNPHNVKKPNGERHDQYNIEDFLNGRAIDIISRTMAAAEDRRGKNNYRRLFAVLESLIHWSQGIVKDFKLSDSEHIQDVYRIPKKSGIIAKSNQEKYIRLLQSIIDPPAAPNYPADFIIKKGSPRHNAHIEYLKSAAKNGDKAAIANLKQHGIEVETITPLIHGSKTAR